MSRISSTRLACSLIPLLAVLLSGCGLAQRTSEGMASTMKAIFYKRITTLHLDITAREALNTDALESRHISAPVMVRVYQLKDRKAFDLALYQQLVKDDSGTLKGDLLSQHDVVLKPGADEALNLPMDPGAKFVAVVAFFRQPELTKQSWRLVIDREALDPDNARIVEARNNQLTLLPVKS
ncbi:type VI secretion system lipoprotein TssJ [Enterobacter asburiae]|uniref:type VI secretion system lipoprotein TssJ n=1 Tax=Enterobacter cloacae complex TaxID=354276 RepID=UPI00290FC341|nr:type VI secretion system lipoprotein TssJ [Enterobacter ludwigii]